MRATASPFCLFGKPPVVFRDDYAVDAPQNQWPASEPDE
jgi:hypothetical protein